MTMLSRLDRVYRRTGANLPLGGDPLPWHHAEMEGYFWRVTDVANRRVLVVLCGVNRQADGDWATVAIASEPGGFIRSAVLDGAVSSSERFDVTAGDGAFHADATHVHIDLGPDAQADLALADLVLWPKALGGGGVFSALPYLGQYWHPHVLGGAVDGTAHVGDEAWAFDRAQVYAEKNWGAGFPERWWWGQAQGFERADVCVAFGGGADRRAPLGLGERCRRARGCARRSLRAAAVQGDVRDRRSPLGSHGPRPRLPAAPRG